MAYTFSSRVRFSEVGEKDCLSLPAMLDYFQDCACFQADSIRQGKEQRESNNRVWVLSAWQVEVNRFPHYGERIDVSTYPYEWKKFIGMRNFVMKAEDGAILGCANSYWTNLNIQTGLPERLTQEDMACYQLEKKLDMEYKPRKISTGEMGRREEPVIIQRMHLDSNHHVNNCQYVRMAMNYRKGDCTPKSMRAEYLRQGRLGDVFYPVIYDEPERQVIVMENHQGEPYFIVEFTGA